MCALLDAGYTQHAAAMDWLAGEIDPNWASRPLTQNACGSIVAQPACPGDFTPAEVAAAAARRGPPTGDDAPGTRDQGPPRRRRRYTTAAGTSGPMPPALTTTR